MIDIILADTNPMPSKPGGLHKVTAKVINTPV